jgi:hypothetical protein
MSVQPTERPPALTDFDRSTGNELAVAAMLDYLALPAATVTPRPDVVHVTVTSACDLSHWMYALGGRIVRAGGAEDVALWTLHTETPARRGGSTVPIRVHAAVVAGEDVLAEMHLGVTA